MSKILVIDDDEQLGRSIGRIVQREGHEHRIVVSLREGCEALETYVPDLVIVELQLDWIVGLDAFRAQIDHAASRHVPLLFTIGQRELFRPVGSLASPGDDWSGKPFDPEELAIRVSRALAPARKPCLSR